LRLCERNYRVYELQPVINDCTLSTLPDYLCSGLRLVCIGLNPSLPSVRAGFYFANPRNRFWRAMQASELLNVEFEPGVDAMQVLLLQYRIGFTDVVKRPTAGAKDLKVADFREWAPQLRQKLLHYQPDIAWFHGKLAYGNYLRHGEALGQDVDWGLQPHRIGRTRAFVTPNPSPANAAYSLEDLSAWYRRLGAYVSRFECHP
jgi:TDG/mug DNA glycosylase family protein